MSLRDKTFQRLDSMDHHAKRSLGQNFLVSELVVNKIIEAAECSRFDQTIEVGPGLGALTDILEQKAKNLTLIELDNHLAHYWSTERKLNVIKEDALKVDWPTIFANQTNVVVGNLPYQISSRLVVHISTLPILPERMIFMFQKEVAQRITASVNTKEYSLLTFICSIFWRASMLLEAGSVDFHPKPRVASRVVIFQRRPSVTVKAPRKLLSFAKICFSQRRKKMSTQLRQAYSKDQVAQAFAENTISEDVRVGQLTPQELLKLFNTFEG